MAFVAPALLWGLLALSVPIVVHWLHLQRYRPFAFSQLAFLQQVVLRSNRRQNLRKWLLLALRLALVAVVVIAAAGWRGCDSAPTVSNQRLIIIDDSPSTQLSAGEVPRFNALLRAARLSVQRLPAGERLAISPASQLERGARFGGVSTALAVLDTLRPAPVAKTWARLVTQLDALAPVGTEVWLFTDGQRTALADSALRRNERSSTILRVFTLESAAANRWIAGVSVKQNAELIEVHIRSRGAYPSTVTRVSLSLQGRRVAQSTVTVKAGSDLDTATAILRLPKIGGSVEGELEIDDPTAPFDNVVPIALYRAPRPELLWVGDEGSANMALSRLRETAFAAYQHERGTTGLASQRLSSAAAVVLYNPSALSAGDIGRLAEFVRNGGGLVLWPGGASDAASLSALSASLGLGVWTAEAAMTVPSEVSRVDLAHPWWRGAFVRPESGERWDGPLVRRRWHFEPSQSVVGAAIATFADGLPLAYQAQVGQGRVLVLMTSLAPEWSDWVGRRSWVALLYRGLDVLAQGAPWPVVADADAQPWFEMPQRLSKGEWRLVGPGGGVLPPERNYQGRRQWDISAVPLPPGHYHVMPTEPSGAKNDSAVGTLAIRMAERESDPTQAPAEQQTKWLRAAGYARAEVTMAGAAELPVRISTTPGEDQRITWLWTIALLLMLSESFLARRWQTAAV